MQTPAPLTRSCGKRITKSMQPLSYVKCHVKLHKGWKIWKAQSTPSRGIKPEGYCWLNIMSFFKTPHKVLVTRVWISLWNKSTFFHFLCDQLLFREMWVELRKKNCWLSHCVLLAYYRRVITKATSGPGQVLHDAYTPFSSRHGVSPQGFVHTCDVMRATFSWHHGRNPIPYLVMTCLDWSAHSPHNGNVLDFDWFFNSALVNHSFHVPAVWKKEVLS